MLQSNERFERYVKKERNAVASKISDSKSEAKINTTEGELTEVSIQN